jgi:hypothetical protein
MSNSLQQDKKEKKSSCVIGIAIMVWLVGVATTTSGHAIELIPL